MPTDHHSAYLARAVAALTPDGRARVDVLDVLLGGFRRIRDQEPRDDVADWANAVVALLEDDLGERKGERRG